ncbi:hypothetical protein EDB92DRAFT_1867520 [Lactarius akahatsu]|uniref:Uncharacterized protein n=1 Tax=Lactarius akahatsu TaxID=416441 RepID=A0AAD4QCZ3_9AGAM|nr:hypothetical protein EDB92DRAFT_1867520 [Lactarius akahatsu]
MRIPSASAFQFSAIFLSSSVAISKYSEKMGPGPSTKLDTLCVVRRGADWGICFSSSIPSPTSRLTVCPKAHLSRVNFKRLQGPRIFDVDATVNRLDYLPRFPNYPPCNLLIPHLGMAP